MEETSKQTSFGHFVSIIDRLRSDGGCPWDREQTHMTLRQATLEEAYEVVHAIETGDAANLKEELGDILLHVVFHSDIAKRAGRVHDRRRHRLGRGQDGPPASPCIRDG